MAETLIRLFGSPSPAGTLDSGHGSEQTGDARESPIRSPPSSPSVNSSPMNSPRRNTEEVRWMEELDNFEMLDERNRVKYARPAPPSQFDVNSKKTWQNPSSARHNYVSIMIYLLLIISHKNTIFNLFLGFFDYNFVQLFLWPF